MSGNKEKVKTIYTSVPHVVEPEILSARAEDKAFPKKI